MLLSRTRQIRTPGKRSTSCPYQLLPARDLGREELIFQITSIEPDALRETRDSFCFSYIASERLLARETSQLGALANGRDDFLDVCNSRVVRAAQPNRIDIGIRDHFPNRAVRSRIPDFEVTSESCCVGCVFLVWAPDAKYVGVSNSGEGVDVEASVESAADETDA
jgi:hypothetical protein